MKRFVVVLIAVLAVFIFIRDSSSASPNSPSQSKAMVRSELIP
jgi:hypothetical protein